jgi:hypothetical protein
MREACTDATKMNVTWTTTTTLIPRFDSCIRYGCRFRNSSTAPLGASNGMALRNVKCLRCGLIMMPLITQVHRGPVTSPSGHPGPFQEVVATSHVKSMGPESLRSLPTGSSCLFRWVCQWNLLHEFKKQGHMSWKKCRAAFPVKQKQ